MEHLDTYLRLRNAPAEPTDDEKIDAIVALAHHVGESESLARRAYIAAEMLGFTDPKLIDQAAQDLISGMIDRAEASAELWRLRE